MIFREICVYLTGFAALFLSPAVVGRGERPRYFAGRSGEGVFASPACTLVGGVGGSGEGVLTSLYCILSLRQIF